MKFTIVIPTYNGSIYVEEALLSAINQTRKPDAIIVSDDNSTDNTLEICSRYKDKITIYKNENGPSGFVEGWNNAIQLVDDGYIAILHQDDLLAPTFLEEAEKALLSHPDVKHFFAPCNYIDDNGNVIREPTFCDGRIYRYTREEYIDAYITIGEPHIHRCPGVVTHRSIFDVCKYRKEAGHIADDDFFYRVGQYTDVIGVMKPLASYREHPQSETEHLSALTLVSRLANDYLFQLRECTQEKHPYTELEDYIRNNAINFVYLQLVYALKEFNREGIKEALSSKNQLKHLGLKMPIAKDLLYVVHRMLGNHIMHKIVNILK